MVQHLDMQLVSSFQGAQSIGVDCVGGCVCLQLRWIDVQRRPGPYMLDLQNTANATSIQASRDTVDYTRIDHKKTLLSHARNAEGQTISN